MVRYNSNPLVSNTGKPPGAFTACMPGSALSDNLHILIHLTLVGNVHVLQENDVWKNSVETVDLVFKVFLTPRLRTQDFLKIFSIGS